MTTVTKILETALHEAKPRLANAIGAHAEMDQTNVSAIDQFIDGTLKSTRAVHLSDKDDVPIVQDSDATIQSEFADFIAIDEEPDEPAPAIVVGHTTAALTKIDDEIDVMQMYFDIKMIDAITYGRRYVNGKYVNDENGNNLLTQAMTVSRRYCEDNDFDRVTSLINNRKQRIIQAKEYSRAFDNAVRFFRGALNWRIIITSDTHQMVRLFYETPETLDGLPFERVIELPINLAKDNTMILVLWRTVNWEIWVHSLCHEYKEAWEGSSNCMDVVAKLSNKSERMFTLFTSSFHQCGKYLDNIIDQVQ